MKTGTKAILWVLTLLAVVYVGQQYRIAQEARASAHTQHTAIATTPAALYKVTQIGNQIMRINETTGETHYWSTSGGGWVKINETDLVTAISDDERKSRERILRSWYDALDPAFRKTNAYSSWEPMFNDQTSVSLQQAFETWKQQQSEERQRAEQETWKPIIQTSYKTLTSAEQAATSYEQFEASLLAATDLRSRQRVITSLYKLMDDAYKQKIPFEQFQAMNIRRPYANLKIVLDSSSPTRNMFCPVGGETYVENVKYCPNHNVALKPSAPPVICPVGGEPLPSYTKHCTTHNVDLPPH